MCNKGYFNTTTPDIAKAAGISTGSVYQYFNDKHDIFIAGVKKYSEEIMFPIIDVLNRSDFDDLNFLINMVIDEYIKCHNISLKAHEELLEMSHLDSEVFNVLKDAELMMTKKVASIFEGKGYQIDDVKEKLHVITNIIDNFCHEVVYHKHTGLDYSVMRKIVIYSIIDILKQS